MLLLRRFVHDCPQCGQLRDFERVLFWILNRGDAFLTLNYPYSIEQQGPSEALLVMWAQICLFKNCGTENEAKGSTQIAKLLLF